MAHIPHRRKLALMVAAVFGAAWQPTGAPAIGPRGPSDWRGLPITFERNDGQHEAPVIFTSRGPHGVLSLRAGEIVMLPRGQDGSAVPARLKLAGAHPAPEIEPLQPLVTRGHYYTRNETITDVAHFAELRMKDVYPGIDVDLHGRTGALEYDFVVAPGADPRDIRIDLRDAKGASIDAHGNLRLDFDGQSLVQGAPVAYQDIRGQRRIIDSRFELADGEARIALGEYDHGAPLTIDPVIAYSTYFGGSGGDLGAFVKARPDGTVYSAEMFFSSHQIVATRFDTSSNTILYQTYIDAPLGNVFDTALGASGDMYIAGIVQAAISPSTALDAYVLRLDPDGHFAAARYIGGSGSTDDFATGVDLDKDGNVYVAGWTLSPDLPVTTGGPMNAGVNTNKRDGFIARFSPSLENLDFLRYFGGSGDDTVLRVAVDAAGQPVAVGSTSGDVTPGTSFPPQVPPSSGSRGFATKFTADGAGVVFSQYVAGQSSSASRVAVDQVTGDAVIAGQIFNANLSPASTRPFSPGGGNADVFVLRLRSDGLPLWASYLGGSGHETLGEVQLDDRGSIYVTGGTSTYDFPREAPLAGMGATSDGNAFVARFRDGVLDFSTLLGGSGGPSAFDTGLSISVVDPDSVIVGGQTAAASFPTVNPLQATYAGSNDGFITKITGLNDTRAEFTGDFNGDGKADLLWQNADGSTQMWLMDGTTMLSSAVIRNGAEGWRVSAVADFSGDGKADILWTHRDGSAEMWIMLGTQLVARSALRGPGSGWRPAHVASFNGDGRADILWEHRNGSSEMWVMVKGFLYNSTVLRVAGTGWTARMVADFEGNGRAGILWGRDDGSMEMWLMSGANVTSQATIASGPSAWVPTHAADFNGDGKADILWRHANGSTRLDTMNGTATMSSTALSGVGSGLRATHVGDLNGDGYADIIWRGRGGGLAYALMNGATTLSMVQNTNPVNSRWVPRRIADFAGDHRSGVVVYDRGTTRVMFLNPDGSLRITEWRPFGSPWTPVGFDE